MLHPEIETEEDMRVLMRDHAELCRLLLQDAEADRCEMSDRLFEELTVLRELNERQELEKAKRALEDKDRQKDQFIAVLAHELRNPLAAIRAATDALGLMKLADPKVERFLDRLDRQSAGMARMLDDLLDASRIALGKVSIELEEIDLGMLLNDIIGENELRVRQAGLSLEFDGPHTRCVIKADRIRLRQVIDNLLSNAIKFTPAPGRVAIRVRPQARRVDLEVADTGIGFDEILAQRFFEPFVQQEQSSARAGGGLGLGLTISSKLAELQGGRLSASSPGVGQGSVFTLTMPLVEPTAAVAVPAKRRRARKRWHILLVEDNKDVADCLAELIELAGFVVKVAYDGSSALALAIAEKPEIIICDLGLPGEIDGYAVARACRADARLQEIRLIAASGYSRPEEHAKAKEAGFEQLIPKPVAFRTLDALLNELAPISGKSGAPLVTTANVAESRLTKPAQRLRRACRCANWRCVSPGSLLPIEGFLPRCLSRSDIRDTSHQLVQSRQQELQDGRVVRLFVAEDQIDRRRIAVERTASDRSRQKVLCIGR